MSIALFGNRRFSLRELFPGVTQGAWYDPSDMSTLFRDAAGTLPVTSVEQPVALILDKSGNDNHAFNPSGVTANYPVLSARYNALLYSERMDAYVWEMLSGATSTATTVTTTSGASMVQQTFGAVVENAVLGQVFTLSMDVQILSGSATTLRVNIAGGTTVEVPLTADLRRVSVEVTGGPAWAQLRLQTNASCSIHLSRIDLRPSNDVVGQPDYQKVNTNIDYNSSGFSYYLRFNGVNQWLQTNSIDFTDGSRMVLAAVVRKLSDVAASVIAELSTSSAVNDGSIGLFGPTSAGVANYGVSARGTVLANAVTPVGYTSPVTNVVIVTNTIGAPNTTVKVDGLTAATSAESQGSGNYGNYPLYIGSRAGGSMWFSGRVYGLVVSGKDLTESEARVVQTYLRRKARVFT